MTGSGGKNGDGRGDGLDLGRLLKLIHGDQARREPPGPAADNTRSPKKPREATRALPGTEEKILVMQQRVAKGEQLFHPNDARWGDEGPDWK